MVVSVWKKQVEKAGWIKQKKWKRRWADTFQAIVPRFFTNIICRDWLPLRITMFPWETQ